MEVAIHPCGSPIVVTWPGRRRSLTPARRLTLTLAVAAGGVACGAPDPHVAGEALRACAAHAGDLDGIAGAVERLNALPAPVDAACLVASLPRPLEVVATVGTNSAQPAAGADSPRIFALLPGLVLGVVPDGDGADLLEFGEWVTPTRTLKGELAVPVQPPLDADAPFAHVRLGSPATTCGMCHTVEEAHPTLPGAWVSDALRPTVGSEVTADGLRVLHDDCVDRGDEGRRCTLLHALFDFGEVVDGAFDPAIGTFTD